MIIPDFKDFVENILSDGPILAIDWGARRIGIAVSDDAREFAFPKTTLKPAPSSREKAPMPPLPRGEFAGIVIGLPQYGDGTDSDTTRRIRTFADNLARETDVPITFVDEALSSAAAEEMFRSAGKAGQKKGLDAFAAAVILEDALAKIKRIKS